VTGNPGEQVSKLTVNGDGERAAGDFTGSVDRAVFDVMFAFREEST